MTKQNKPRFPDAIAPQVSVESLIAAEKLTLESEATIEGVVATDIAIDDDAKYIEILSSRLSGVRLTGQLFDQFTMVDVILDDCDLSGVTLSDSKLLRVQFNHCRMSGFDASGLKAQDVVFNNCKLDDANFRMSSWERCQFIDCQLQGAEFNAAVFKKSQFSKCVLERAQFSQAKISDLSLHGSQLEGISGAESLKGAVIGSDQVLALAAPVFVALGIEIADI